MALERLKLLRRRLKDAGQAEAAAGQDKPNPPAEPAPVSIETRDLEEEVLSSTNNDNETGDTPITPAADKETRVDHEGQVDRLSTEDSEPPPAAANEDGTSKETAEVAAVRANANGAEGGEEEEEVEDESKYLKAFPLAVLTFGLCLSTFVVALDNTIIATAIPRITTVFDSLNDVGWYGKPDTHSVAVVLRDLCMQDPRTS